VRSPPGASRCSCCCSCSCCCGCLFGRDVHGLVPSPWGWHQVVRSSVGGVAPVPREGAPGARPQRLAGSADAARTPTRKSGRRQTLKGQTNRTRRRERERVWSVVEVHSPTPRPPIRRKARPPTPQLFSTFLTRARTLLPAALASVPIEFVVVRVRATHNHSHALAPQTPPLLKMPSMGESHGTHLWSRRRAQRWTRPDAAARCKGVARAQSF
jgi:hypothetical protein